MGIPAILKSQDGSAALAQPVFFMHIAKTAGSYFNEVLKTAIGAERMATHCEAFIGCTADLEKALDAGTEAFCGHIMYPLWNDIAGPLGRPFRKLTLLRDPIEHLASHLQWLDYYNRPMKRHHYLALDQAHQQISDRIAAIDLTDVNQLDAYLTNLSGIELRLFDNCQARYFLVSGRRDLATIRPLTLADTRALARAVSEFDGIGFQDRLRDDIPRLGKAIGVDLSYIDKRVNPALSTRRINTADPTVRQVLGKRTIVDQWLWRHARAAQGLAGGAQHG